VKKLVAIYGSPRKEGNSDILLDNFLKGVESSERYKIENIYIRDLKISPCLEIYKCKDNGRCIIDDDFQKAFDLIDESDVVVLSTPVMFYTVSAHTKIFMDRCQSFWVRKYLLKQKSKLKDGYLLSVGGTKGEKLFDGIILTIKYFFDAFDCKLKDSVLVRGVDEKGDILKFPEQLEKAINLGASI